MSTFNRVTEEDLAFFRDLLPGRVFAGEELSSAVFDYPHGVMDRALPDGTRLPPDWALQHPSDYLDCLRRVVPEAMAQAGVTAEEYAVCDALKGGPLITARLAERLGLDIYALNTKRLEQEGVVIKSGLTPTDMMVLKGDLTLYGSAAAEAALKYVSKSTGIPADRIPDMVYEMVVKTNPSTLQGGYFFNDVMNTTMPKARRTIMWRRSSASSKT